MKDHGNILALFHPLVEKWFRERLGAPTDIQAKAWPEITKGRHALVTAPTGSGKTLTAFLWAIDRLITGAWSPGQTRVLYVSPLKALNNDIRRNLTTPLEELATRFRQAGQAFPQISVLTRNGDTPAEERRQMLKHPPEILITTPESLNIILSSRSGRAMLSGIATVILDEIHAVVGTKRGTHLITAVDRLMRLTGEFQRIALSATVRPLETVADFVGGYVQAGDAGSERYEKRHVEIIRSTDRKRNTVNVCFPKDAREQLVDGSWWPVLVEAFKEIIRAHRSTLLFVNSRRTAEKVTRLINEGESRELAYAHHGSLSREIRLAVEQRLKEGELKAIVATSSLELGIDIGDLDRVILIETPPAISSAIQRIGRSGHRVGGTSRGLLYPTHGRDFLNAAVMAKSVTEQDIEPIIPIEAPLDVLAQVLVSMVSLERWDVDELFAFIRTSYPYRRLSRRQFDLVLSMLAGRYAETRLRELKPRISIDRVDNTVHGREGVQRLIYMSGGTIPDRGYYDLRLEESHAKIGELDEEFVWERSIGDTFSLGPHAWRIQRITSSDVEVVPTESRPGIFPFWKAEDMNRDFQFSEKILLFLERVNDRIDSPSLRDELLRDYFLNGPAADELIAYLRRQREMTGADLPHRHHLLIEHFEDPLNTSDMKQVILHTVWGGRVNRPFGLALQAAWEEKYHYHLEIIDNNDCILLMLPHEFSDEDIFSLVTPENLERLLRRTLEKSGFFGARFRENAGRALLLPRASFKKRLPLWLNRLRSKKLMDAVLQYADFPILLETWRTCLQDEFDLMNLRKLLDEVRAGQIRLTEATTTTASPFADGLIWKQTNTYMYEDDTSRSGKSSRLSAELLKEVLFSASLRPRIPRNLVESLEAKLQRTASGYAPRSADDLLDWAKERLLIPKAEWEKLLNAVERDHELPVAEAIGPIKDKLLSIRMPRASTGMVCALENLDRVARSFDTSTRELDARDILTGKPTRAKTLSSREGVTGPNGSLSDILLQWLSFYGPIRKSSLRETLGLDESTLDELLAGLAETEAVILDLLTESAEEPEICDRENLETLLRMARRSRQPSFRALPIDHLPLFLAAWQGLITPGENLDDLQDRLDQLFGYPAQAEAWEKYLLPARLSPYYGSWLDSLMQGSGLLWFGWGNKKLSFAFDEDLELFLDPDGSRDAEGAEGKTASDDLSRLFPRLIGRYSLPDIAKFFGSDSRSVTKKLWDLAWRGRVTNDTFAAVRQGILTDFAPVDLKSGRRRPFRAGRTRWGAVQPFPGSWHVLGSEGIERDPIDEAELVKDRVRQLLKRYGILFRELTAYELPFLQWSAIFKALRIMELSGEILSGHFFEGIPGVQFISHEAFRFLSEPLPEDRVYWMNAVDPASMSGIRLEALKGVLPSRIPSTHLVYRGKKLVAISRRSGSILTFHVPPDDPRIADYLSFFKVLLGREFSPETFVAVETINGKPAPESDYAGIMKEFGFSRGYKALELTKRYS
ncbi:MAG: ATP-dependent RNA helicase DbpA [Syntrophorhabdaceae bacterium PtaU1.Bin034]|nr:MAG: ATP-dependent RNA helicase DbpA [Syntrophorhabdaceae bacterium PtaU1.Bin034]